jgi:endonuclease/exonuclease/phosphatase family metal-dependent hydrolase
LRRDLPVLALYPIALIVLTAIHLVAPQRSGPLALTQVFAPHLFLLALPLVPFAVPRTAVPLRACLAAVLVVAVFRFGPDWVSLPADEGAGTPVEVVTWNLQVGSDAGRDLVAVLTASRADIVVLEELTPDHVALLEAADPLAVRYPHRLLRPADDVLGIGLLSVFPIVTSQPLLEPSGLMADLDIGGPRSLTIASVHPRPPRYDELSPLPLPIAYRAQRRDDDLGVFREQVDALLAADRRLVLLGDFNVAPTEPAFAELAEGLLDVHAEVGLGPGWTWRPSRIAFLPAGLLRIDHVFVSPDIQPVASSTDCSHPGDHCVVSARIVVPPEEP